MKILGKNVETSTVIKASLLAASVMGVEAGASAVDALDAPSIVADITKSITTVMAAGAGILAVSVGGRVAVKWVKRLAGFA